MFLGFHALTWWYICVLMFLCFQLFAFMIIFAWSHIDDFTYRIYVTSHIQLLMVSHVQLLMISYIQIFVISQIQILMIMISHVQLLMISHIRLLMILHVQLLMISYIQIFMISWLRVFSFLYPFHISFFPYSLLSCTLRIFQGMKIGI